MSTQKKAVGRRENLPYGQAMGDTMAGNAEGGNGLQRLEWCFKLIIHPGYTIFAEVEPIGFFFSTSNTNHLVTICQS